MIQNCVVILVVLAACVYLFRYFRRSTSKPEDSHGCPSCTLKKEKLSR